MKIFILEDDPARQNLFMQALSGHHYIICSSVKDAKASYAGPYDLVCLDHDLMDVHYSVGERYNELTAEQSEQTGTEFAAWLAETQPETKVVIHSWNPSGALRMARLLTDAGWSLVIRFPFGTHLLSIIQRWPDASADEPVRERRGSGSE